MGHGGYVLCEIPALVTMHKAPGVYSLNACLPVYSHVERSETQRIQASMKLINKVQYYKCNEES